MKSLAKALGPSLAVAVAAAALACWRWPSVADFVAAIDSLDQDCFQRDFTNHYLPMSRQLLSDPRPVSGYLYPAAFALLLAPIGLLPADAAAAVWFGFQLLAAAALAALGARSLTRLAPWPAAAATALLVSSVPLLSNVKWGQVSVLLMALVLGAWLQLQRGRQVAAGALLGLAAAIKLYPGVFVILFVAARAWRALAAFAATFALLFAVVPAAILGIGPWLAFERGVLAAATALQHVPNTNSQSLTAVVERWWYLAWDAAPSPTVTGWLRGLGMAAATVCATAAFVLQRRPSAVAAGLPPIVLLAALPFVIGTMWPHYLVFLPACQVAVFAGLVRRRCDVGAPRRAVHVGVGAVVLSALLANVSTFELTGHWALYNGYGLLLAADLLLLVAVTAAVRCGSPAPSQSPAPSRTA